jgi:putative endonuclease
VSRARGNIAEERAGRYLQKNGFTLIERNFYSRFGEIDIIAQRNDVLHFIEVKSGLDYESAIQNITPAKLRKILKTVDTYLAKHALSDTVSIDAVIVTPTAIEHIENITL